MGVKKAGTTDKVMVNGKQQADAWANISLVNKAGQAKKLGGISMYNQNALTQMLIKKTGIEVGENADVEITIKLNFSRVDHSQDLGEF